MRNKKSNQECVMKNPKCIHAKEIVKPGKYSSEFVGIEISRNSEHVTLICVGSSDWEDIEVQELEVEKYKFKVTEKDRVHHLFTAALNATRAYAITKENELLSARRNLRYHENKVKEYFGKPITIESERI